RHGCFRLAGGEPRRIASAQTSAPVGTGKEGKGQGGNAGETVRRRSTVMPERKAASMKRFVAAAVLWLPIVLCGAETPAAASEKTAAKSITPELIRSHIRMLASDLFEGRGPSTRG